MKQRIKEQVNNVINNEIIFYEALKNGMELRDSDGWHPNDFGYLLIARNIYNKMVSLEIIDAKPIDIFSTLKQ